MAWRVRRSDVDFFHDELWKDLRPFPLALKAENFAKDCFTKELAVIEASVMMLLGERLGFDSIPRPVAVEKSILIMRRAEGVRLFDLIRHLKAPELMDCRDKAARILDTFRARCIERLRLIQLHLVELKPIYSHYPYPLEEKLTGLLELFLRVMDIRPKTEEWRDELEDFLSYWDADCVSVPFRDATTKNMIVVDSRLSLGSGDDMEGAQRAAVRDLVLNEPSSFWSQVPLVDIDFSSIVHLTSIEDDPISLLCHEWTLGARPLNPTDFVLDSKLGEADGNRAAATLLVRYLRFGGRKLAYRIINSQGFKVRFAFDDPLFYFGTVRDLAHELSPDLVSTYSNLFSVVQAIADGWRSASRANMEYLNVDHLRRYYRVEHYWQQSPGEYQQ